MDDAYELAPARRRDDSAMHMPTTSGPGADAEPSVKPSWAKKFEEEKSGNKPERLRGRVVRWNVKGGWGFIHRSDGLGDIFAHQRSLHKTGFRSCADGEEVEFEVEVAASTGKLEAVRVTGPGGAEVIGTERRRRAGGSDSGSDAEEEEKPQPARPEAAAPAAPKPPSRPPTAFVPRGLKRPATGGGGRSIPLPKAKAPKPAETATQSLSLADAAAADVAAAAAAAAREGDGSI